MPVLNGPLIREALATAGIPASLVAERCGITPSALENIVSQRQKASVEVAYLIATHLKLSPRDLSPGLLAAHADARTVRERRQVSGQKLGAFAYRLQISRGHLDNIERGLRNPSPELLLRIARALRCRIADIAEPAPRAAADEADSEPERVLATAGAS